MTNLPKDPEATDCVVHFKQLMGVTNLMPWVKYIRPLLKEHSLTPTELKEFMTWAVTENTSDNPKFSSVDYLAKANDPMVTLVKHASGLIKVWRVNQKGKKHTRVSSIPANVWCNTKADGFMVGSADYKACQARVSSLFEKGLCAYADFGAYFHASTGVVWDC